MSTDIVDNAAVRPRELNKVELGRLAVFQRAPWNYVTRRVESLDLLDDRHYAVTVSQQLTVPFHRPKEPALERDLLISLGQFSKARRPDMRTTDPTGVILPILHHDQRAKAVAVLFITSWQEKLFEEQDSDEEAIRSISAIWALVQYHVEHIAKRSRREAHVTRNQLKLILLQAKGLSSTSDEANAFIERLLGLDAFWDELKLLAETTPRIAEFRGTPGKTYILTTTYTERFHYSPLSEPFWRIPIAAIRYALGWLGLDSIPVSRATANFGQARSLWVLHSVPDGLEPLRFFWERDIDGHPPVESTESDRAVVCRRTDARNATDEPDSLQLDFQISPSSSIFAAMALAFLLWFVSVYIYQRVPPGQGERELLAGIATALAGVPATLAGVLAYRGPTFIRRASRGPRLLLTVLSLLASVLAIVLGLKTGNSHHFLENLSYALSVYALFVFGIFGYVLLGPRWRKSIRSRKPRKTRKLTPAQCRHRQMWTALLFSVLWIAVVVAYGRIIYVFQIHHESVFSKHFPTNMWNALRPWFTS